VHYYNFNLNLQVTISGSSICFRKMLHSAIFFSYITEVFIRPVTFPFRSEMIYGILC
jgi:hypothetical protein